MNQLIFAHLLGEVPVEQQFEGSLPLHLTLVHWFETVYNPEEIASRAKHLLQTVGATAVSATNASMFGPNENVPVMEVEKSAGLLKIHRALLASLEGTDARLRDYWLGDDWRPHVSDKPNGKLALGETILVDSVDLIQRDRRLGTRTIIHRFNLSEDSTL